MAPFSSSETGRSAPGTVSVSVGNDSPVTEQGLSQNPLRPEIFENEFVQTRLSRLREATARSAHHITLARIIVVP